MTSSSLPTFTLSVGATGAASVAPISSTVTAAFTASSPTTGTTTKSITSSSVTRAASSLVGDYYKFSTFSVAKSSFTAATETTTLSMVVQKRSKYTGNQYTSWATITPTSGTLSVTAGTGGSVSSITYGTTSTCTITVAANTGSARTIVISGKYNTDKATSSLNISQSADGISGYKDLVVDLSYANASPSTANVTVNPSLTVNATPVYISGKSASQVTIPASGYSVGYTESGTSSYASVSSAGVITWNPNAGITTDRTVGITASVTCNSTYSSLAGSDVATAKHTKDSIKTYGDVTASIGTGITAANGSATVSGSQILTWTSGHTTNGTITYDLTNQYIGTSSTATSGTTITRYSLSGTTLSHTTMGTNTGYDIVVITATGQGSKTKTAQTSVYNGVTGTEYGNYKTTISLANATPTCSSGTTTATIKTYRQARSKYTSGSYGSYGSDTLATVDTPTVSESVNWLSVGTVSNSSTGTYTATVTYNANSKNTSTREATLTANANSVNGTVSLTQGKDSYTDSGGVTTYGEITGYSTTDGDIPASGGSATATASNATQTWSKTAKIRTWSCGGTETLESASSGSITVYPNPSSFSASASSKGVTESSWTKVDSKECSWTSNGKTATDTLEIWQKPNTYIDSGGETTYGDITGYSTTDGDIPCSGGSATATASNATQTWSKTAKIRTWSSGEDQTLESATSGSITVYPNPSSYTGSASSKGTTESG